MHKVVTKGSIIGPVLYKIYKNNVPTMKQTQLTIFPESIPPFLSQDNQQYLTIKYNSLEPWPTDRKLGLMLIYARHSC